MARELNNKCIECANVNWRIKKNKANRPECYNPSSCHKKLCYYRKLEHYRALLRKHHRYLKHLKDKCFVCGSRLKLEAHHVLNQANGGPDSAENIITLCHKCHNVITIYNRRLGIERKLLE